MCSLPFATLPAFCYLPIKRHWHILKPSPNGPKWGSMDKFAICFRERPRRDKADGRVPIEMNAILVEFRRPHARPHGVNFLLASHLEWPLDGPSSLQTGPQLLQAVKPPNDRPWHCGLPAPVPSRVYYLWCCLAKCKVALHVLSYIVIYNSIKWPYNHSFIIHW